MQFARSFLLTAQAAGKAVCFWTEQTIIIFSLHSKESFPYKQKLGKYLTKFYYFKKYEHNLEKKLEFILDVLVVFKQFELLEIEQHYSNVNSRIPETIYMPIVHNQGLVSPRINFDVKSELYTS